MEVEVPPNTTASLRLPGRPGDELEVGSGKYCWTYPYSDTAAKRAPLTLDSTIGEIIDDAEAFTLVLAAIRKHGTELADRMLSQEERPLRESVSFMPQSKAILASIEEALASLKR